METDGLIFSKAILAAEELIWQVEIKKRRLNEGLTAEFL